MRRVGTSLRVVGIAIIAAAVLSACSSSKLAGASAFGSNKLKVAEISNIESYTAEGALREARAHFRNRDY